MPPRPRFLSASVSWCIAAGIVVACAGAPRELRYVAKGWLAETPQGEAEIIGEFVSRADCEAAIDEWLQSQVVGASIHAECLPAEQGGNGA